MQRPGEPARQHTRTPATSLNTRTRNGQPQRPGGTRPARPRVAAIGIKYLALMLMCIFLVNMLVGGLFGPRTEGRALEEI